MGERTTLYGYILGEVRKLYIYIYILIEGWEMRGCTHYIAYGLRTKLKKIIIIKVIIDKSF